MMGEISKKMGNSVPFCHKALDLTSSLGTPLTRARDRRFLWLLDTKGVLQVQEPYQFKKLPVTSKRPRKNNKWKDESQDSSTGSPRYSKHHILRYTGKKKAEPRNFLQKKGFQMPRTPENSEQKNGSQKMY